LFSDKFLDRILFIASPLIDYYSPGFDPEIKLEDFLDVSARRLLLNDNSEFSSLAEPVKEALSAEKTSELTGALKEGFAVELDPKSSFKENFYTVIRDKFQQVAVKILPEHLFIIASIIIFTIVRSLFWLLGWLVSGISFLIYQILLATKFAEIYLESKSREAVVLK
jgi:hypothetical protein